MIGATYSVFFRKSLLLVNGTSNGSATMCRRGSELAAADQPATTETSAPLPASTLPRRLANLFGVVSGVAAILVWLQERTTRAGATPTSRSLDFRTAQGPRLAAVHKNWNTRSDLGIVGGEAEPAISGLRLS